MADGKPTGAPDSRSGTPKKKPSDRAKRPSKEKIGKEPGNTPQQSNRGGGSSAEPGFQLTVLTLHEVVAAKPIVVRA